MFISLIHFIFHWTWAGCDSVSAEIPRADAPSEFLTIWRWRWSNCHTTIDWDLNLFQLLTWPDLILLLLLLQPSHNSHQSSTMTRVTWYHGVWRGGPNIQPLLVPPPRPSQALLPWWIKTILCAGTLWVVKLTEQYLVMTLPPSLRVSSHMINILKTHSPFSVINHPNYRGSAVEMFLDFQIGDCYHEAFFV